MFTEENLFTNGNKNIVSNEISDLSNSIKYFTETVISLREKCAWHKELNLRSLSRFIIEEAYELVEAIENNNLNDINEEAGDLSYQIILLLTIINSGTQQADSHGGSSSDALSAGSPEALQVASPGVSPSDSPGVSPGVSPGGSLNKQKIIRNIINVFISEADKLKQRHPHVFLEETNPSAKDLEKNWENMKHKLNVDRKNIAESIPKGLPSLALAIKLIQRAERNNVQLLSNNQNSLGAELIELIKKAQTQGIDLDQELRAQIREIQLQLASIETK